MHKVWKTCRLSYYIAHAMACHDNFPGPEPSIPAVPISRFVMQQNSSKLPDCTSQRGVPECHTKGRRYSCAGSPGPDSRLHRRATLTSTATCPGGKLLPSSKCLTSYIETRGTLVTFPALSFTISSISDKHSSSLHSKFEGSDQSEECSNRRGTGTRVRSEDACYPWAKTRVRSDGNPHDTTIAASQV